MVTVPNLPFSGQQLKNTLDSLNGAVTALQGGDFGKPYVDVRDYGADLTGATSANAAIVAAATAAGKGGIVYLPSGKYLLSAQLVLEDVTLMGAGYAFTPMRVASSDSIGGTVLICGFESTSYESVVHLKRMSRLKSLALYYPNQSPIRPDPWTPTTTPWAITAGDFTLTARGTREVNQEVCDVAILDFTHAIRGRTGFEGGKITNVRGNPLTVGIDIDGAFHSVHIDQIDWWPYGGNSPADWQDGERRWTLNNLVAYRFGRVDGLKIGTIFSIGTDTTLQFYPSEAPNHLGHATTNFTIDNLYADGTNRAIHIPNPSAPDQTWTLNFLPQGNITNAVLHHYNNPDAADMFAGTRHPTVHIEAPFDRITISAVRFEGGGYERPGSHCVLETGATNGWLSFAHGSAVEWDSADAGNIPAFEAKSGSQVLLGDQFTFQNTLRQPFAQPKPLYKGNVFLNGKQIFPFIPIFKDTAISSFTSDGISRGDVTFTRDGFFHLDMRIKAQRDSTAIDNNPIQIDSATALPTGNTLAEEFAARMPSRVVELPVALFSVINLGTNYSSIGIRISANGIDLLAYGDNVGLEQIFGTQMNGNFSNEMFISAYGKFA